MNSIEILGSLACGKRVIGTLLTNASPYWPQKVAELDLDFVFIDTEHIAYDRTQVSSLCHSFASRNVAPFVRIPSPDPYQASMVSDDGACGIIAPYVETVEQVKKLVGAIKLKPIKGEILSQLLGGSDFKSDELRQYIAVANADKILVINIESVPAIKALDGLLSAPGVDVALIGPHDLSCSLGIPEQYGHPKFLDVISTFIEKAQQHGVAPGIHFWSDLDQEISWCQQGMKFLIHTADIIAFRETMQRDLSATRKRLGDESIKDKANALNL